MARKTAEGEPIIIKKYANRRLYNTRTSSYITLDHLAQMVKENIEFKVLDAKTGADLTHTILTQIIMEEEANGEPALGTSRDRPSLWPRLHRCFHRGDASRCLGLRRCFHGHGSRLAQ